MIIRLLLVLLLGTLTGCTSGYFHLTDWTHPAAKISDPQVLTPEEKQAHLKALRAVIKTQQKIIDRYNKQDPSEKKPDPLTFVTDVEFAEAKARQEKAQAECNALGG